MKHIALLSAGVFFLACSSLDVLGTREVTPATTGNGEGGLGPDQGSTSSSDGTTGLDATSGSTATGGNGGNDTTTTTTSSSGMPETGGDSSSTDTAGTGSSSGTTGDSTTGSDPEPELPNLLEERQDIPIDEVNAMVNDAFNQLFFGNPTTQAVFVDEHNGTAYIKDIANGDVRTDSMAYGLLTTVQLNQREIFDKLWAWAKMHMMPTTGPHAGLLFWRCNTDGSNCVKEAATDAMSTIASTLWMAESRWGKAGSHSYHDDATALLDVMTGAEERNGGIVDGVVNCFNVEAGYPRHGSQHDEEETPVDYLMPAFYEVWARRDTKRSALWQTMAENARELLSKVSAPRTGLYPEVVTYDGDPVPGADTYVATTSRTLFNLTLDYLWTSQEAWIVEQNERLLDFFLLEGVDDYVAEYRLDGFPLRNYNTAAHRSLVALAAGTTSDSKYDVFLEELLSEKIPAGPYRYYDGMLYMLSLMVLSGQMTPNQSTSPVGR